MKDPFDRTKVVLRHLPPALSQSALMEQIDAHFAGRYKWFYFRPGKNSQKHPQYSRAYIDFKQQDDVVEFAEFLNGHVFVNEKGTQFKIIVEYAPSQRVPKAWSKKDGREGTMFKDPEYLEFLELISKPVENLPSAEIQLERREAERAGAPKESFIVTPLMDYVRQKRAAMSGSQRSSSNGKLSRRSGGASPCSSSSSSTRRGSEKRRISASMYVLRESAKSSSGKDKSKYILVPRREDQQLAEKSASAATATGTEVLEDESGPVNEGPGPGVGAVADTRKKKVILLKGKEREISQSLRREASGRMIKSILSNKEPRQIQLSATGQSDQQIPTLNLEKDKRPPRPLNIRSVLKDHISSISQTSCSSDCYTKKALDGNDVHGFGSVNEKQEKRTRNKDRPDRGIWAPLRRSDGSHASDEYLSSPSSLCTQLLSDSFDDMTITQNAGVRKIGDDVEDSESSHKSAFSAGKHRNHDVSLHSSRVEHGGNSSAYDIAVSHGEVKIDITYAGRSEVKTLGSGRNNFSSVENGSHRHAGRRGPGHGGKDVDSSMHLTEGKPSKKGVSGYGSHEKQVWVQKSGSGS
ncbi:regulator of nonsense transcripts UPF3-like [Telopea speciosissima]|uniref:regulator of nonsense transcripts UPF3-like n=1 Tax=Telopea speciosissima TaxID=54955 RepID=UPI001CC52509|nr:regulator of nonsense transcripts UPF3-like [Telopea speciosissima]XP_043704729.1 regulator of nonsense transcripts UPF3-like [Telopea speciosissima]XP_043704730.1 regulator of nonsense transcripts UPF3-like [Telopea speciosissima]